MSASTIERPVLVAPAAGAGSRGPYRSWHPVADTPDDPQCPGRAHAPTQRAYRHYGCRCSGAVAAHETYQKERREAARQQRLNRPNADPDCPARMHPASMHGWRLGCRCPATVYEYNRAQAKKHERALRKAERAMTTAANEVKGWRVQYRVSRNGLVLLREGFVDQPTPTERMLIAESRLALGEQVGEIGARIGVSGTCVAIYVSRRGRLRDTRTARRLAEARYRAARDRYFSLRDQTV